MTDLVKVVAYLESDGFVGLGSKEDILVLPVRGVDSLLVGGHESVHWDHTLSYFWVVDL